MKQFFVVARCLRLLSTRFRVAFTRPVHAIVGRFETLTSVDGVNFTLQVTRGISANRLVDGELHASVAVQLDMRATVSAPINCTYAFARATNIERRIKSCADKGFQSWIYHVATVLSSRDFRSHFDNLQVTAVARILAIGRANCTITVPPVVRPFS